jgi:hypothetical protein
LGVVKYFSQLLILIFKKINRYFFPTLLVISNQQAISFHDICIHDQTTLNKPKSSFSTFGRLIFLCVNLEIRYFLFFDLI